MDTEAVWPAGTRAGVMARAQIFRYLVRLAARTESTGRMISTPPMLSRVRWPSPRPNTPAAAPVATNALPRVVNPASIDRMRRLSRACFSQLTDGLTPMPSGGPLSCLFPGGRTLSRGSAQLGQRQAVHDRGQHPLR